LNAKKEEKKRKGKQKKIAPTGVKVYLVCRAESPPDYTY
jgi:hypothetical protein